MQAETQTQSTTYGLEIFAAEGLILFPDWAELQIKPLSFWKGGLNWCEENCSSGACVLAAGWRNKSHLYQRGNVLNFIFWFLPPSLGHAASGPPSVGTSSHGGWPGPALEGCKSLGWIFAPTVWLRGEGLSWERFSDGKSFLLCPCVPQEGSDFSCHHCSQSSLAGQVRAWLELWLCYLSFKLKSPCWVPFLKALFASKNFSVCFQKFTRITGGRKKERREKDVNSYISSKMKNPSWSWSGPELLACGMVLSDRAFLLLGTGGKWKCWVWNPAAAEYLCLSMQIVTMPGEVPQKLGCSSWLWMLSVVLAWICKREL